MKYAPKMKRAKVKRGYKKKDIPENKLIPRKRKAV